MSREIKRVPTDFTWPLNEIWEGYLQPSSLEGDWCPNCDGRGSKRGMQWLNALVRLLDMVLCDSADQKRPMHPWLNELPLAPHWDEYQGEYPHHQFAATHRIRPDTDIIEWAQALLNHQNDDRHTPLQIGRLGNSNSDNLFRALMNAASLPEQWSWCPTCDGEGTIERYPGQRAEAAAWTQTDPPEGEGWQVWETVSEGSPISPVFAHREQLVDWLMSPANTYGISQPLNREQAEAFVAAGSSIGSFVTRQTSDSGFELIGGDAAVHELSKNKQQQNP
jgi:hypothetical protein